MKLFGNNRIQMIYSWTLAGIILICMSMTQCMPEPKPHQIIMEDHVMEVHFGRKMSRELLDSVRNLVGQEGVVLNYPELKYDGQLLSKLAFTIQFKGRQGVASTNFVYRGKPFGFRILNPKSDGFVMTVGELSVANY